MVSDKRVFKASVNEGVITCCNRLQTNGYYKFSKIDSRGYKSSIPIYLYQDGSILMFDNFFFESIMESEIMTFYDNSKSGNWGRYSCENNIILISLLKQGNTFDLISGKITDSSLIINDFNIEYKFVSSKVKPDSTNNWTKKYWKN